MSRVRILALAVVVGVPLAVVATDAPHVTWCPNTATAADCQKCHVSHNAVGSALTVNSLDVSLCLSCHTAAVEQGSGSRGHGFSQWVDAVRASPGTSGTSHQWSALPTNRGATAPATSTGMLLQNGLIVCGTCHNQHSNTATTGGSQFTSYALNAPQFALGSISGPTMSLTAVGATSVAKGYLIQAVAANSFKISHDNGKTWFACNGASTAAPPSTATPVCSVGTNVALEDPNVKVTFAGTVAAGNQWTFYIGFPFLRISNDEGQMCTTCHKNRNQLATNIEGNGTTPGGEPVVLGSTVFSHPVGELLAKTYDRASNAILDADGSTAQSPGDGNPTNNIDLSPTNKVTCLSCHSMHNTDSNSLTVDQGH